MREYLEKSLQDANIPGFQYEYQYDYRKKREEYLCSWENGDGIKFFARFHIKDATREEIDTFVQLAKDISDGLIRPS